MLNEVIQNLYKEASFDFSKDKRHKKHAEKKSAIKGHFAQSYCTKEKLYQSAAMPGE